MKLSPLEAIESNVNELSVHRQRWWTHLQPSGFVLLAIAASWSHEPQKFEMLALVLAASAGLAAIGLIHRARGWITVETTSIKIFSFDKSQTVELPEVRIKKVWTGRKHLVWPGGEIDLFAYERPRALVEEIEKVRRSYEPPLSSSHSSSLEDS